MIRIGAVEIGTTSQEKDVAETRVPRPRGSVGAGPSARSGA
ncbi:hypothetical protein [Nocardioides palaemonis]|nr:hypothetical protein [Nocardioides palaemonis]